MVAVKAQDVDWALKRIDPKVFLLLFYGPDAGLVSARAKQAASRATSSDDFHLVKIDGDAVAADPGRLCDEALAIGLFGDKRTIWLKPTSKTIAPAVEAVLGEAVRDALILIEAGDLNKTSPLRAACEKSPFALVLPCYADTGRDLSDIVENTLRSAGFSIEREAREVLVAHLGANRLATLGELDKLMLYVGEPRPIVLADIEEAVSDVSALNLDALMDALFCGEPNSAETAFRRLAQEGVSPAGFLGAGQRHATALLQARLEIEQGKDVATALRTWRGLHFKRHKAIGQQLSLWTVSALQRILATLQKTTLATRRVPDLGQTLTARALLDLAHMSQLLSKRL